MNVFSHISYPALFFILLAKTLSVDYSFFDLIILMFFSIWPDLDVVLASLFFSKKGKFSLKNLFDFVILLTLPAKKKKPVYGLPKHRLWPSHWPFVYLPLLVVLFFYPQFKLALICLGIYFHFFLDSFFLGEGIMWLAPFSRKRFVFLKVFSFVGQPEEIFEKYHQTIIPKLEMISFLVLLVILAWDFMLK